jgi:UDP-glucose 6-dehydrogenase
MISYLLNKGLKVKTWEPRVNVPEVENELKLYENFSNCFIQDNLEKSQIFGEKIIFCENYKQALIDSSAIVFCNNHSEFHQFDLIEIREGMAYNSVIFDLYDIFEEQKLRSAGFESVFKLGVYSDI